MEYLIVFSSKEEMVKFKNEGHILPDMWWVDYMENGKLSIMPKEDGWEGGEWPGDVPDVIRGDFFVKPYDVFLAMPEWWRENYNRDRGDGDYYGYWIGSPRGDLNTETMEEISSYWANGDDAQFFNIWTPPPTRPITIHEVVNNPKKQPESIIDGLWGKGETLLISAKAGVGKSLMVSDIALKGGNCQTLWEMFRIPKPITSLIIQSEVARFAQKSRIDKSLKANPDFNHDMVYFLGGAFDSDIQVKGWLDDEKFQDQIKLALANSLLQIGEKARATDTVNQWFESYPDSELKPFAILILFMAAETEEDRQSARSKMAEMFSNTLEAIQMRGLTVD